MFLCIIIAKPYFFVRNYFMCVFCEKYIYMINKMFDDIGDVICVVDCCLYMCA